MADTYEAFYNGKPLNPNRGLPTMTYAQAEASGLTESERLWCRTDGEDTPITADDIPYDSNTSVKDKIDYLNDGRVVLYIPANTYSKYSEALTAMQTEYNKLTSAEKRRSVVVLNDSIIANIYLMSGRYTYSLASSNANYIVSFELENHKYYSSTITSNSVTFDNNSENAQALPLALMVI